MRPEAKTQLVRWTAADGTYFARLTVTDEDMRKMENEPLEMLRDAMFLIEAALRGEVDGPLTLPRTGLAIRTTEDAR